jgi:hypothetical protein
MKTAQLLMDNREYPSRSVRETIAAQRNNTVADMFGHYRRTHSAFDDVNRPLESVSLVIAPDPVVL